jgi:hypothetical protein
VITYQSGERSNEAREETWREKKRQMIKRNLGHITSLLLDP